MWYVLQPSQMVYTAAIALVAHDLALTNVFPVSKSRASAVILSSFSSFFATSTMSSRLIKLSLGVPQSLLIYNIDSFPLSATNSTGKLFLLSIVSAIRSSEYCLKSTHSGPCVKRSPRRILPMIQPRTALLSSAIPPGSQFSML